MLTRRPIVGLLAVLVTAAVAGGCGGSVLVHRPADSAADRAITALWVDELLHVAQDGDWLLSRSYSGQGDLVVIFTRGEELSHAAMIDVSRGTVVESIGSGVREIPLEQFVDRNRHLMVVRPAGAPYAGTVALERARSMIGHGFDVAGMLGFGSDARFYCSELVYWASGLEEQDPSREVVITPGELLGYGELIYWSGQRDDPQVQRIARARGWDFQTAHAVVR